jgi:hypothetical protein
MKTGEEIFWSKVDRSKGVDSCWKWLGVVLPDGYGFCGFGGKRNLRPHRVAFGIANPGFVKSLYICHRCDNPLCCNPAHLFSGTQQDNMSDKVNKGRQARGETHGMVRLTGEQALRMRELRAQGETFRSIGEAFGMSTRQAWRICMGKSWKHL